MHERLTYVKHLLAERQPKDTTEYDCGYISVIGKADNTPRQSSGVTRLLIAQDI